MEAADIFAVNKADRPGAPALMAELRFAAHLHDTSAASRKDVDWQIPVLSLEAQRGVGVPELVAEIRRHRAVLESSGAFAVRRRERVRQELEALLVDAFRARVERGLRAGEFRAVFDDVVAGTRDPYSAAAAILPVISLERL
jgi:LAO/AO transport system kinase